MDNKIRDLREVDWNNPHAFITAYKDGTIIKELSSYDSFLKNIGYESELNNIIEFMKTSIDDPDSFGLFRDRYIRVCNGENEYEFDSGIGNFHYHTTLSGLKGKVGVSFNDQTKATTRKTVAEKKYLNSLEVIHDLKSLLTAGGLVDAIERHYERGNPDRAKRLMISLKKTTESMDSLIKTYMDIGKAESGAPFRWERTMFSKDIVEPVIGLVQPKISDRRATVERRYISRNGDVELYCDQSRLRSVFFQLANNALDHADDGLVISWGHSPIEESQDKIIGRRLNFWNSKSSIPPDDHEEVFEKFYTTGGIKGDGTGMGLNLVKRTIVEEHHGDISIDSGFDSNIQEDYTNVLIDLYNEDYLRERGFIQDVKHE